MTTHCLSTVVKCRARCADATRCSSPAAAEVFNERGPEASLDEVARHAGVGVGTVYRRFPSKEELAGALFMERIDSIAALAEAAGEAADPWSGLVSFREQVAEMLAAISGCGRC